MDTNLHAAGAWGHGCARRPIVTECDRPGRARRRARGFSLVEMMVVMSLLSVIVLGLYSVFNRTQRALLSNNAQVDVLENGRITLDLLGREFEQAAAWGYRDATNNLPNMWIQLANINPITQRPYINRLTDQKTLYTNLMTECFFLSRSNNYWVGNGYFLATPTNGTRITTTNVAYSGVGTLYRFSAQPYDSGLKRYTPTFRLQTDDFMRLTNAFLQSRTNGLNAFPIADGIVHFVVRPYDANGSLMTNNYYGKQLMTNIWTWVYTFDGTNSYYSNYFNPNVVCQQTIVPGHWDWQFYSNSLPAYVELELGVLVPQVLQRMRSLPTPEAQRKYLDSQPGAVNMFHKMIPLRNAQP